jgi:hypothetical protein
MNGEWHAARGQRAQGAEHRAQGTGHRAQGTEHRAQSAGHRERTASGGVERMKGRMGEWENGRRRDRRTMYNVL